MTGRSPEAKRRRAPARARAIASGQRVACDVCKVLHKPPACPEDAEPVGMTLRLPPYLARELNDRVMKGEQSPWVVRLIRRELNA